MYQIMYVSNIFEHCCGNLLHQIRKCFESFRQIFSELNKACRDMTLITQPVTRIIVES